MVKSSVPSKRSHRYSKARAPVLLCIILALFHFWCRLKCLYDVFLYRATHNSTPPQPLASVRSGCILLSRHPNDARFLFRITTLRCLNLEQAARLDLITSSGLLYQHEETQRALKRDNALRSSREQLGRWDFQVAIAVIIWKP